MLCLAVAPTLWASEPPGEEQRTGLDRKTKTLTKLPEPLNGVFGNLLDLEKAGYFKITKGRYARTSELDEDALIWTVEVLKPISCRHAILLLRRFSDVRFYWLDKRLEQERIEELLWKKLYYESEIASGAVRHKILRRHEWFEIWVPLDAKEVERLRRDLANRVVFSHPDR